MAQSDSGRTVVPRRSRAGATAAVDRSSRSWRRSDSVLWRQILDDVVLLPSESDLDPFALAGGAELWSLLRERRDLSALIASLYPGVQSSETRRDELLLLLSDLERTGAVEVTES